MEIDSKESNGYHTNTEAGFAAVLCGALRILILLAWPFCR